MTPSNAEIQEYRELQSVGFELECTPTNAVVPNHGSETPKHLHAKTATVQLLLRNGYAVATEVAIDGAIADILAYGHEDRRPIIIEIERNCVLEVAQAKLECFCVGPIRECYVIEGTDLGHDIREMHKQIATHLGLN